jgi:DNA polymerase III subunit beta
VKLIANRKELADTLAPLAKVAVGKYRPQLACVLLHAHERALTMRATDGEVTLERTVVADTIDVQGDGMALVPARDLSSIIAAIKSDTVKLETEGDFLFVRGDTERFKMHGYAPGDLPPAPERVKGQEIGGSFLHRAIKACLPVAETGKGSNYSVRGIYLTSKKGKGEVVATDGQRVHILTYKAKGDIEAILPIKASQIVLPLLAMCGEDETVSIGVSGGQCCVEGPTWTLWTLLVDGTFPPYKVAVPDADTLPAQMHIEATEWMDALRVASMMADSFSPVVGVRFDLTKKQAQLWGANNNNGHATTSVDIAPSRGEGSMVFGLRPRQIEDAIAACDCIAPSVSLEPKKPVVIRSADFLAVVALADNCPVNPERADAFEERLEVGAKA